MNNRITRKQYRNRRVIVVSIVSLIVVLGSFFIFKPKAIVGDNNTEVIALANALKNENMSAEYSEKIIHKSYKNYYVKSLGKELCIGVYKSNGEVQAITTIIYNK